MLKSVVDNFDLIKQVNCLQDLNLNVLKKDDLKVARDLCLILSPFEEITRMISGEMFNLLRIK